MPKNKVKHISKAVCPTCFRALDIVSVTIFDDSKQRLVKRCRCCNTEEEIGVSQPIRRTSL